MCLLLRRFSLVAVVLMAMLVSLVSFAQEVIPAPERKDALETGTVYAVAAYPEGRVFDIVSKVIPVYDNYPFYDILIHTPERDYVVRYESMGGYYPSAWLKGKQIKFRREKGRLLLLRYDGELVPARIL